MSESELIHPSPSKRLPVVPVAHQKAVDEFLAHFESRLEATLRRYQEMIRGGACDPASGQYVYFKHQLKTVQFLRAMNEQRRTNANRPRPR